MKALNSVSELTAFTSQLVDINDRQSKLLASADVQAYQGIVAMDNVDAPSNSPENTQKSDDQIAFEEALERGHLTHDEQLYFKSVGLIDPKSEEERI